MSNSASELNTSWPVQQVLLPDLTPITVSPLGPEHGERLQAALLALTPESRYQRFMGGIERFSPDQLRYMTACDGVNHLACFAYLEPEASGNPSAEPLDLGVARCIRNAEASNCGEVAVVVGDAWQGRGVGSALLGVLSRRSQGVGITHWYAEMLAENAAIRALLAKFGEQTDLCYPETGVMGATYRLRH